MIIWLNGPFGVGKTRLAHELRSRLPGSFIFDPEQLGFTLQNLTPPNKRLSDFQEYPLWRMMVRETLHHAAGGDIPIIVPMTLVDPRYFAEIVTHLHSSGVTVHHVALLASRQTILARLEQRGDDANSWPAQQIDRCLAGLHAFDPAEHLATDTLSTEAIADRLAECFAPGLTPVPQYDGPDLGHPVSSAMIPKRFTAAHGPRVIGPTDGRAYDFGSFGVRFLVWAAESGGGFSLVEHPIPPRTLVAPLHRHTREDEYSFVLEGTMGAQLGEEVVHANTGTLVFKPRGQWHTFWNAGEEPCRILEIISPGGFEHFFVELGEDPEAMQGETAAALDAKYGLEVDYESIERLCEAHGLTFPA